jgi:hypothetical protein
LELRKDRQGESVQVCSKFLSSLAPLVALALRPHAETPGALDELLWVLDELLWVLDELLWVLDELLWVLGELLWVLSELLWVYTGASLHQLGSFI